MAYTSIDDSSKHFQIKKWTGNAGTNAITLDGNSNMQPDFMWHKEQNDTNGWHQFDSSRGVTKYLASQSDGAEGTFSGYLSSFDSNGFTAGSGDSSMNSSGTAQCSWMWHCNSGTTSSNTDGSITSTVQANTTAGFSIVTYTGSGSDGSTVGHGLGAVPAMVIFKCRSDSNTDWRIYHQSISPTNAVSLNSSGAQYGASSVFTSAFSSTQLKLENEAGANGSSKTYVAYCFAEKQGYSKFGKYIGQVDGDNGPFVYTGFKPAFVMVKLVSSSQSYDLHDTARDIFNPMGKRIIPNSTGAEESRPLSGGSVDCVDFLSNGFKVRSVESILNSNNGTYIYMAFAENPFVTSTGIPTTAR